MERPETVVLERSTLQLKGGTKLEIVFLVGIVRVLIGFGLSYGFMNLHFQ